MPRALAVETSGRIGSIALVDDGRIVAEDQFPHGLQHASDIIPMIDRLTRSLGWRPIDFEEVYVSVGPGSFTGLRIGVTLAKTLAFATGARLLAVPSCRVLAGNAPDGWTNAIIVLDAKRGQIFTARFALENGLATEKEPAHLDRLPDMLGRSPKPVHLIGEGIPYHRQVIAPDAPDIIITPEDLWRPRASVVAELGFAQARLGHFVDPYRLTPIYLRLPEAEEKRLAAEGS